MGAGAVAAVTTGGIAAIPAGIVAGTAFDTTDSIINHKPKGCIATVNKAVNKPIGENVFDLVLGVVCDGMAGYSGGRIGTKIANVKVARLKAKMTAKMDKLNAGMDPNSITLTVHGIKAFRNSEINTIRHGTPVYWDDVKGNGKTATTSEKVTFPLIQTTTSSTYEAFNADYYEGEQCKGDTQEKCAIARNYGGQKSCGQRYHSKYSSYKSTTIEEIKKISDDHNRDPRGNLKKTCELIVRLWFLLLRMPNEFNYTGAITMNNAHEGLLHSFVRHFNEWNRFIDINDILKRLQPIRNRLDQIMRARNGNEALNFVQQLKSDIESLPNDVWVDVKLALFQVQERIYQFIQRNLTYSQYLGEGINNNGQMQVYFDVGDGQVMAIAVSRQLYDPIFPQDRRPVRSIITIFFMTKKEYEKRKTTILY
nr:uncharacterized protein LOC124491316 [Dermatophagoides farinae]